MKADSFQQTAITLGTGPKLISAGPGSGKTFVLIRRIQYLIQFLGIPPNQILVLTFSKAAAEEMKTRFIKLMREDGKDYSNEVYFGTFHALFYRILRNFDSDNNFRIISEHEKIKFIKTVLSDCKIPLKSTEFALEILNEIQSFKAKDYPLRRYHSRHLDDMTFQQITAVYENLKDDANLLDFDDILVRTRDFLYQNPAILSGIQKRFQYVLIDEFQDINPVQYEVISMIADTHKNIYAVGDDDQSIYAFRGANPSIMKDFLKDFPGAEHYALSVNYRSGRKIVEASQKLIRCNANRIRKEISSNAEADGDVRITSFENTEEEYKAVLDSVLKLTPGKYKESAIILRTNILPIELMQLLGENNIPVCCTEKPTDLSNHPVTKDILAYLKLAGESKSLMDTDLFLRVCNKPNRYIPAGSLKGLKNISFIRLLHMADEKPYLIRSLLGLQTDLKRLSNMEIYPAIQYISGKMGYKEYLCNKRNVELSLKNSPGEVEVLETLIKISSDSGNIAEFEEKIRSLGEIKTTEKDGLKILTMHSSKGLEFENVWIPDLYEDNIPIKQAKTEEEIEEERRLLYVAMTRAKSSLFVYGVKSSDKKTEQYRLSRFFSEII